MFQSLRANNQIYLFYKEPNQPPRLEVGVVTDVSAPRAVQKSNNFMAQMVYVVDIHIKVGDSTAFLQGLAANAVTDIPTSNPNVVVSMSKEQISEEVKAFKKHSVEYINNVPYHENAIALCDSIYQQLNPEILKQQQTDEEIRGLKTQVSEMSKGMAQLMEMNKRLLEQLKNGCETSKGGNKKE